MGEAGRWGGRLACGMGGLFGRLRMGARGREWGMGEGGRERGRLACGMGEWMGLEGIFLGIFYKKYLIFLDKLVILSFVW
jgi:hypothetical protein